MQPCDSGRIFRASDPLIDRSHHYDRPQVVPDGGRTSEGNGLVDPPNRAFTRSRSFWNITYSIGTKKIPIELAASMPANTGVPTPRRLSCAAPVAMTSGSRPRMKAIEVIITARNRV